MATALARSANASLVRAGATRQAVRPVVSSPRTSPRLPMRQTAAPAPASRVATKAVPVEVAQIAGEAGFIAGTAFAMMAITLVGLAVGFVLLRVENLVEEGKL